MKRIIALLVVLSLSASFAMADYVNPPGWEANPYFTHQSWEFDCDANPASPDPTTVVSPGQPYASLNGATWQQDFLGATDYNGWLFSGPFTADPLDPQIAIYVPNIPNPDLKKEIWLQITFMTNYWDLDKSLQLFAVANGTGIYPPIPDGVIVEPVDPNNPANGQMRLTARIDIFPQPADEWIYLTASLPEDFMFFLDEIDIDTRCVPEPSTLAMLLAAGLFGFVVSRRRK